MFILRHIECASCEAHYVMFLIFREYEADYILDCCKQFFQQCITVQLTVHETLFSIFEKSVIKFDNDFSECMALHRST